MNKWYFVFFAALVFLFAANRLANALEGFNSNDRVISVKGFSEKEVKADLAIWNIQVKVAYAHLNDGNKILLENRKQIIQFLIAKGIPKNEISVSDLTVIDLQTNEYQNNFKADARFIINEKIQVRSSQVELVRDISRMTDELLAAGVALSTKNDWQGAGLRFVFTKLNDIKPTMISDAIQNGKKAAEQFAKDSDTELGEIRNANQGLFSITERDDVGNAQYDGGYQANNNDIFKKVRVVISLDYNLKSNSWF